MLKSGNEMGNNLRMTTQTNALSGKRARTNAAARSFKPQSFNARAGAKSTAK
jgi:hypothetical protein